jgi:hypothetical protein
LSVDASEYVARATIMAGFAWDVPSHAHSYRSKVRMISWRFLDHVEAARWSDAAPDCHRHFRNIGCSGGDRVLGPDGSCGWFREGERYRLWFADGGERVEPTDLVAEDSSDFIATDANAAFVVANCGGDHTLFRATRGAPTERLHVLEWCEARELAICAAGSRPVLVVGEQGIAQWRRSSGYVRLGLPPGWTSIAGGRFAFGARAILVWTGDFERGRVGIVRTDGDHFDLIAERSATIDLNIGAFQVAGTRIMLDRADGVLEECLGLDAALGDPRPGAALVPSE